MSRYYEKKFFEKLMTLEGDKLTNTANDNGGLTHFGLTQKDNPTIDVIHITPQQANDYYYKEYYQRYKIETIENDILAFQIFQLYVNFSPSTATRILQKAINSLCGEKIDEDGLFGEKTLSRLNNERLIQKIMFEQIRQYSKRVKEQPNQIDFLVGWVNRAILSTI